MSPEREENPPTGKAGLDGPARPLEITHRDFLERALSSAGEWTRYADPKALAVLLLLGLGFSDLIAHASRLVHPQRIAGAKCELIGATGHGCSSFAATAFFVIACAIGLVVVGLVTHALFSRLTIKGLLAAERDDTLPRSRFFFGEVSRYGSQEAYFQAVRACSQQELLRDLAGQVYEVSKVGKEKHRATQRAYVAVMFFLFAWAAARIFLATSA